MVGRNQMLLPAGRRQEKARRWVVPAVSQELQGEERVCRTTLAQVYFDGVRKPIAAGVLNNDEVERKPARSPPPGQGARRSLRRR